MRLLKTIIFLVCSVVYIQASSVIIETSTATPPAINTLYIDKPKETSSIISKSTTKVLLAVNGLLWSGLLLTTAGVAMKKRVKTLRRNTNKNQNSDDSTTVVKAAITLSPTRASHWSAKHRLNSYDLLPFDESGKLKRPRVQLLRAEVFQDGLEYDEEIKAYFFRQPMYPKRKVIHTSYYELHRQLYILTSSPGIFESESEREMLNQLEEWLHRLLTGGTSKGNRPDPLNNKHEFVRVYWRKPLDAGAHYLRTCKQLLINIYETYGYDQPWTREMEDRQQAISQDYLTRFRPGALLSRNLYNIHQHDAFAHHHQNMSMIRNFRRSYRTAHFLTGNPEYDFGSCEGGYQFWSFAGSEWMRHTCYYQIWRELLILEQVPELDTRMLFLLDLWLWSELDNPDRLRTGILKSPPPVLYGYSMSFPNQDSQLCMQLMIDISRHGYETIWTPQMEENQRALTDELLVAIRAGTPSSGPQNQSLPTFFGPSEDIPAAIARRREERRIQFERPLTYDPESDRYFFNGPNSTQTTFTRRHQIWRLLHYMEKRLADKASAECFLLDLWLWSGLESPDSKADSSVGTYPDMFYGYNLTFAMCTGIVLDWGSLLINDPCWNKHDHPWTRELEMEFCKDTDVMCEDVCNDDRYTTPCLCGGICETIGIATQITKEASILQEE